MLFCNFSVMIGHGRCFSQIFRKPCYCFPCRNASISPIKYSEPNATVFSVDDFDPEQVIQSAERLLQTPELQKEPIATFVEKMKVQQTENAHMAWMLLGEDHGER